MVRLFVDRGMRVLISSKNNLAVDNVLEKLVEKQVDCVRLTTDEEKIQVPVVREVWTNRKLLTMQRNVLRNSGRQRARLEEELTELAPQISALQDCAQSAGRYQELLEERRRLMGQRLWMKLLALFRSKRTKEWEQELEHTEERLAFARELLARYCVEPVSYTHLHRPSGYPFSSPFEALAEPAPTGPAGPDKTSCPLGSAAVQGTGTGPGEGGPEPDSPRAGWAGQGLSLIHI